MMKTLKLQQMQASYFDRGSGPAVILVHCSSASHKQWSFLDTVLCGKYRTVAPDLLGYGRSSPWPLCGKMVVDSDLDLLNELIGTVGSPVHLIAHSYGAATCLEAARIDTANGNEAIASLCLIEPVAFHLLKGDGSGREWHTISNVARICINAVAAGDANKAANAYMGFWLGPLRWRFAPKHFRKEVIRTVHKVADEFQLMFELDHLLSDYSSISCPLTLVCGGRSPQPATRIVELLADSLPQSKKLRIASAGHMSPFTHRSEVMGIVRQHLSEHVLR